MTREQIANRLLEAITVLDEPFHREAVAATLQEGAAALTQRLDEADHARLVELLGMALSGDLCRGPACQHPDCVDARAVLAKRYPIEPRA